MHRGQVTQFTDQPPNMTNNMPVEIQHNTTSRQIGIVDISLELERLKKRLESLLGPNLSNGPFAQTYEAPPLSQSPTPCVWNVPTCFKRPTIGHSDAGQAYNELTVPDDHFAHNGRFTNTSYPIVPTPVAMDPKPAHGYDIGKGDGKEGGKTDKKTKKHAKKAKNIMVDESSTFSSESEIQFPNIQHTPRDGSANQQDLPQITRLEHQVTINLKSPTMPSKVIIEFQKT